MTGASIRYKVTTDCLFAELRPHLKGSPEINLGMDEMYVESSVVC